MRPHPSGQPTTGPAFGQRPGGATLPPVGRVVAGFVVAVLLVGCSSSTERGAPTTTVVSSTASSTAPAASTLRAAGEEAGVRVGVALPASRLDDSAATALAAAEFGALTPENEMKWSVVEAERDVLDFAPADRLVAFAGEHDMAVRGHTLVWGQAVGNGLPDWLAGLPPEEVRAEVGAFVDASVARYRGRVPRWDVVNEPISLAGPFLDENPISRALGPDWVAWSLERAHAADPDAELWINEHSVESLPEKADALVALVEDLVAAGAPLDGVGLQTHLFSGAPPAPGAVASLVGRLRDLGVAVAITELDLPLVDGATLATQADGFAQVVEECVAAGCEEVTVWGLDDSATWLDTFLARTDTRPLLFDEDLRPKPAHAAVRAALLTAA
jgi:endo-1,4-beta-xylanase